MIDRFLADLVRRDKQLRLFLRRRELDQALSLLLMLPTLRAKAMPKVLAIVEALLRQHPTNAKKQLIGKHVGEWYDELAQKEAENVYQMVWLGYFMKANGLAGYLSAKKPKDPIARAPRTSRFSALGKSTQSHLFRGVIAAAKAGSMLQHLDIFDRTP